MHKVNELEVLNHVTHLSTTVELAEQLAFDAWKLAGREISLHSMENCPFPVWIKQYTGSRFIISYVNPSFKEFYGFKWEDCVGRVDYKVWDIQSYGEFFEHDALVLETRQPHKFYHKSAIFKQGMFVTKWVAEARKAQFIVGVLFSGLINNDELP